MSAIRDYIWRYPQLTLPVTEGASKSDAYAAIVRRGQFPAQLACPFSDDPNDKIMYTDTPAGRIEMLCLANRADFVRFVQILAHRCEPVAIPVTQGASTIFGVTSWRRIEQHRYEYEAEGGADWNAEFARFTADPQNYRDAVVVLAHGYYSAVPPEELGLTPEEWVERSLTVRQYHEAAHIVCRKLWPGHREAIRDEVLADAAGLIAAFGRYDAAAAHRCLGADGRAGRISNYADGAAQAPRARAIVEVVAAAWEQHPCPPFEFLTYLEEGNVGADIK